MALPRVDVPGPTASPPAVAQRGPQDPHGDDEETLITRMVAPATPGDAAGSLASGTSSAEAASLDCVVVIYTREPTLLGKRYVLEQNPTRIGRSPEAHILLDADSVSRRHAHLERHEGGWRLVDDGSTNGTFCNDDLVGQACTLRSGDRLKVGSTIFKFLSGADVEAQYHEEIYRMTIEDGLTQVHNKRYLGEALEREILRSRRHGRDLALLIFDLDHFKSINDRHGHLAGDQVLKDLARLVEGRVRRDDVFARYGGEEFVLLLPETSAEGARTVAESLRAHVESQPFQLPPDPRSGRPGESLRLTISLGGTLLQDEDRDGSDLLRRADELLYAAKHGGRNRVCM